MSVLDCQNKWRSGCTRSIWLYRSLWLTVCLLQYGNSNLK